MSLSRQSAVFVAPLPLRLVLAITFIWAGVGKFAATFPVQGEDAALLANMGHDFSKAPAAPSPANPPSGPTDDDDDAPSTGATDSAEPPAPSPEPQPVPQPESQPESQPDSQPATQTDSQTPEPATPAQADPAGVPEDALIDEAEPATADRPSENAAPDAAGPARRSGATTPPPAFTAADFPEPLEVRRYNSLALLTYKSAHPATDPASDTPDATLPPIWPEWAARDAWPRYLALAAAITEVVAGVLVLVGLLTRLSALALAGIMLVAAWLTELGPAIQMQDTLIGFLPNNDPWDTAAWKSLLWQFSLCGAALALAFAGPGAFSLDRALASGRAVDDDDLDED